ncbi:EAL domain-containing protein [Croceibacterium sp. TMG7-5b_MA50]|uniref:putative bifunctional diguanylate cyclase/phosphodiesterase n=1 Tax=Croceibacterium sp. TMG7-5b_MA50 TaxID=3121290 RepID=UPI003221EC24
MLPLRLILFVLFVMLGAWANPVAAEIVPLRDRLCHAHAPRSAAQDPAAVARLTYSCGTRPHSAPGEWVWLRLRDRAALADMPAGWQLLSDQVVFTHHAVLVTGTDGSVQQRHFVPGQLTQNWAPGGLQRITVARPGANVGEIYLGYQGVPSMDTLHRVSAAAPSDLLLLGGRWLAVIGVFTGAIVTVLVFGLLVRPGPLVLAQRWYVAWSLTTLVYGLAATNALALFWPWLAGPTTARMIYALVGGTTATNAMVVVTVLESRSLPRWLRHVLVWTAAGSAITGLGATLDWPAPLTLTTAALNALSAANFLAMIVGIVIALFRRSRTVWLLLISYFPLLIVGLLWLIQPGSLSDQSDFISMCRYLALAAESVALALLLADRVRQLWVERDHAEQGRLHLAVESEAFRRAAMTDPLTGLGNRAAFQAQMRRLTEDGGAPFMLLLVDVDHLKDINDRLGHDAGDRLLLAVGQGLEAVAGPQAHVARIGGDEFSVLLPHDAPATAGIESALEALQGTSVTLDGRSWTMTFSVGLACYPEDGEDTQVLKRHADLALYQVKRHGRRGLYRYDPALRKEGEQRRQYAQEAAEGLPRGEFQLFFQPIVRLADGGLHGFEALLRWQHPEHGLLTPASFADMLADGRTGHAVQTRAVELALAALRDQPELLPRAAVNLTAAELDGAAAATRLLQRMTAHDVAPGRLCVEVTEDVVLDRRLDRTVEALTVLHRAGVPISLDDFGTGYASLIHLKHLPFDTLKVDRSFTATLLDDHGESEAIIRAIIGLAQGLDKQVVVEGVETDAQRRKLMAMGCRLAQGHLFGRPAPVGALHRSEALRAV